MFQHRWKVLADNDTAIDLAGPLNPADLSVTEPLVELDEVLRLLCGVHCQFTFKVCGAAHGTSHLVKQALRQRAMELENVVSQFHRNGHFHAIEGNFDGMLRVALLDVAETSIDGA